MSEISYVYLINDHLKPYDILFSNQNHNTHNFYFNLTYSHRFYKKSGEIVAIKMIDLEGVRIIMYQI
jgi:hypothetical protein